MELPSLGQQSEGCLTERMAGKLESRICRQIQDLHANFGTKERRKHRGRSRSCTTLFLPNGVEIELIFALRAAVSDILAGFFSTLPYLSIKLGHWQSSRSCTYTLFLPKGFKIELIFVLWATVSDILTVFQNCHIWT